MKNITFFKGHCCGCGLCMEVCPVDAITMRKNDQGFYYPIVDEKKCIGCNNCVRKCAFNADASKNTSLFSQQAYALKHCDEEIRGASRSGGAFTAISDIVLEAGGVIYGCVLENNREAIHIRAVTKEDRDLFRGSKYIQSNIHNILTSVKEDLKKGLWVLFSGTACQVDAVRTFCMDVDCKKLLLIDIVCHGVPSPKVWQDYLKHYGKKKTILSVDFRDKKHFGWSAHRETIYFSDGSMYSGEGFKRLFYDHYILRRDCFACPYKCLNRVSDITLADCWGIAKQYEEFYDDQGVSLVLINSDKGNTFFRRCKNVEAIEVDVQKLLQPPLQTNWSRPVDYEGFWQFYHRHSFKKVIKKYASQKEHLWRRGLRKAKRICEKVCKKLKAIC